jgi:hypothetical protein
MKFETKDQWRRAIIERRFEKVKSGTSISIISSIYNEERSYGKGEVASSILSGQHQFFREMNTVLARRRQLPRLKSAFKIHSAAAAKESGGTTSC